MHRDRGASAVEYALLAAACAAALTVGAAALRGEVRARFDHVAATPSPTLWTPAPVPSPSPAGPGGYVPPRETCVTDAGPCD